MPDQSVSPEALAWVFADPDPAEIVAEMREDARRALATTSSPPGYRTAGETRGVYEMTMFTSGWVDCGCYYGVQIGDPPRPCPDCDGSGRQYRYTSGHLALYPGGPMVGRESSLGSRRRLIVRPWPQPPDGS